MNPAELMRELLVDEPPFVLRPDQVIASGRRRRQRRALLLTGTAGAAAVGIAGAFALLSAPAAPSSSVSVGGEPTTTSRDSGDLDNPYYRVARAHTPPGWTMSGVSVDGDGIWANVSDDAGHGPGRFGLYVSKGGLQPHPCSDPEFVAKAASCTETMLDGDTRLVVRTASRTNPVNDVQVGIIHGNGDGVYASDDNAVFPDPPARLGPLTPEEKRALNKGTIGSAEPIYALDDLVAMVKAMDAITSGR